MRIRFTIFFAQPINILGSSKEHIESRLESRLESKLAAKIIQLLQYKNAGKAELAQGLGHKTVSGELHKQIKLHIIEMTLPDKPSSRLQKYKLTKKGFNMVTEIT